MSDSGNVFGKPFRSWVTKQIETRQESLGYKDYNVDDLKYQNTKTPWIRLASTVDINQYLTDGTTESRIYKQLLKNGLNPQNFTGDVAAKNFILQGGVVSLGSENQLKTNSGLNHQNQYYNGAYGWGGLDERGYVPMPGIIDSNIIYKSDGAFAEGTINMKCFSRSQLILMDVLYMRPGVNLLLEFGWSTYLNNEGKLETYDTFLSDALDFTLNKNGIEADENDCEIDDGSKQATILGLIEQERKNRSGNYEAMFGMVTNFNWTFNSEDGSYNCQTKIIGHGDVIQSLAINVSVPEDEITGQAIESGDNFAGKRQDSVTQDLDTPLVAGFESNKLSTVLMGYYRKFKEANLQQLEQGTAGGAINEALGGGKKNYFRYTSNTLKYANQDVLLNNFQSVDQKEKTQLTIKNGILGLFGSETDSAIRVATLGAGDSIEVYMKFSALLAIIQHDFLLYDKERNPYFYFNMKFQNLAEDSNYMANYPGQFSADPRRCLVPYKGITPSTGDFQLQGTFLNDVATETSPSFLSEEGYAGKLSEVLLNLTNVINIAGDAGIKTDDGKISITKFINKILDEINVTRGGINNFKMVTDAASSVVKIIDSTPIRWKTEFPPNSDGTELCVFNTFGVKNKIGGSIVKNIDIQSSISKDMADVIAVNVGGGSNGYNVNGTGLNKWSEGITDRIFPDLSDASVAKEPDKKLEKQWNDNIIGRSKDSSPFFNVYSSWIFNSIELKALTTTNLSYASLLSGIMTSNNLITSPYFLPFTFNMDIEGISGIRLYERFDLDNNVLPSTYDNESLEMQISSCDHTVNGSSWVTKMVAIPQPSTQDAEYEEPGEMTMSLPIFKPVKISGLSLADTDLFTLTSKYPILQIFIDQVTEKKQIYLHHTVSSQNIENVLFDWSSRTDQVSTQYITNNDGDSEQVFPDENWAYQLGIELATFKYLKIGYQNLNKTALGIELCSYGGLTWNGEVFTNTFGGVVSNSLVSEPVDRFGNPRIYKNYKYFEKYNDTQINNVKTIIQGWMSKYDIKFAYNYNELFPPNNSVSYKAMTGEKGIYTHNSVKFSKSDVFPQKELIDMLKSIATELSDEDKVLSYGGNWEGIGTGSNANSFGTDRIPNAPALLKAKNDALQQLVIAAIGTDKAKNYRGAVPPLSLTNDPSYTVIDDPRGDGPDDGIECTAIFKAEINVYGGNLINNNFTYDGTFQNSTGKSTLNLTTINGQPV